MYLLDTNIVSELRKAKSAKANLGVVNWAKSTQMHDLYISVITILEIQMGILNKASHDPHQASVLETWLQHHVMPSFEHRILPVDTAVAFQCARLHVPNRQADRDALIEATAITHGLTLVTRNIQDFRSDEIMLHNPWMN